MDLRTCYLGLDLPHPVVASAGPLSSTIDGVRRLADAGAAAIVLCSLFEEQIRWESAAFEYLTAASAESFAESLTYFPAVEGDRIGPDDYLELVRESAASAGVPIIGSLNGATDSGWIDYARQIQSAGAAAIELNIYHIPTDPDASARAVEERYLSIVRHVRSAVSIPVAVKVSPFFSAMGEMARRLVEAGADGLVLFNRFFEPDFDLETLSVAPTLELSSATEIRLPLLWIAVLHGRINASLAATRGVQSGAEVVKYLLAGADATMTTSALLRHGPARLRTLVGELTQWMEKREYESVRQMKGAMSRQNVADPGAFERANYLKVLGSYRSSYAH